MDDLLTELAAASKALADRSTFALGDAAMIAAHNGLRVIINRLTAVDAILVHDIDGIGIVRASGSANASTWLREHSRMSITEAHKLTALGTLLTKREALAAASADEPGKLHTTRAAPELRGIRAYRIGLDQDA